MRAAIYVRVSTDDQARHGYSLAEQREACRRRAGEKGASSVNVYADEGVSGSLLDRPGLNALREAIRDGRIELIIVRDPDRLSRKLAHQLLLTEEFEKAGVKLEFLDFTWQDTPEGRLFYSIRGAVAEFEREKIRDRMVRGKNQKARQGGIPIGFYAYGYNYDTETGKVTPHEDEARVVQDMFNWFVSEDIGVNGVARRLNELGIPTRKNKGQWHRMVVRQMLMNSAYKGSWRYKDQHIPVPAILDPATWEKAREKLKEARRLWAGKSKNEYLLSGLVSCSDCGNTMTGINAKWWGKRERRYTCQKKFQGSRREGCHPIKLILASPVEDAVWEQVCAWLQDPDALAQEAMTTSSRADELSSELARLEKFIADVDKGREAVLDALATGLFELDSKTKKKLTDLKSRKDRLETRLKEISLALQGTEGAAARVEDFRALAREVLARLDTLDFSEKKALVRSLVAQVSISGRGLQGGNGLRNVGITVVARVPEPDTVSVIRNNYR
ncbi:MAG: recombinase family protein [Actinobacteria bacterium]|nr:recombinase family protein [Actinomycetota bacterium]